MKINLLLLQMVTILLIGGCTSNESMPAEAKAPKRTQPTNLPALMIQGLEAHGGLDRWQDMRSLRFGFPKDSLTEVHEVSLTDRKTLITRGDLQVGNDGEEVWVSPNLAAFGKNSARFYHNVYFYFYAMPFVLADPGIRYEKMENRIVDELSCPGVKISFNDGVGDAPDDYYIAYFHPADGRLHLLLYTVTFGDEGPNENFSAIKYEEWAEVNGLHLPKRMVWYKFADDQLGERRREKVFEGIEITGQAFPDSKFARPEGAEISK